MRQAAAKEINWERLALVMQIALTLAFVVRDIHLIQLVGSVQPYGIDFLPIWTGVKVEAARLYDFAHVTAEQTWLYTGKVRPFVYPPSALIFLKPLAWLPFWVAYPLFMAATGGFFMWAAHRLKADWRLVLIPTASMMVLLAGQLTFLVGGLVMTALTLKNRPLLAGLLFGITGAIKPQMLVLLPLALAVQGNWRTFWATGATAGALVLVSLAFGASWLEWFDALGRFRTLVDADWTMVATSLSPLARWGDGVLFLTAPMAAAAIWLAFRRDDPAAQALALLGGALAVSPYAMNYELALLVPAVLALGKFSWRTLPFWLGMMMSPGGAVPLLIALGLLFFLEVERTLAKGGSTPLPAGSDG